MGGGGCCWLPRLYWDWGYLSIPIPIFIPIAIPSPIPSPRSLTIDNSKTSSGQNIQRTLDHRLSHQGVILQIFKLFPPLAISRVFGGWASDRTYTELDLSSSQDTANGGAKALFQKKINILGLSFFKHFKRNKSFANSLCAIVFQFKVILERIENKRILMFQSQILSFSEVCSNQSLLHYSLSRSIPKKFY